MARPTTYHWSKLSLWLGDGASPEDFTTLVCGIVTKEFTLSAETSDFNIGDCDDLEAPAWTERVIRALSAGFTGSGLLSNEIYPTYRLWMLSGLPRNARVVLGIGTPGYYSGSFVLTQLGSPGNEGDGKLGISIALQSNGEIIWTAGAP